MKKIVLASLMALAVGGASAQAYVGGSIGMTHLESDCTGTSACDSDDTGYKVYAGYTFTPNLAVEVGYANFGKASAVVSLAPFGNVQGDIKSTAPFLVGVYRGDFTPALAGVARLGIANVDTKVELSQGLSG